MELGEVIGLFFPKAKSDGYTVELKLKQSCGTISVSVGLRLGQLDALPFLRLPFPSELITNAAR